MRALCSLNGAIWRFIEEMVRLMRRMQMQYREPELSARQALLFHLIESAACVGIEEGNNGNRSTPGIGRILELRRRITEPFLWQSLTEGGPTPQVLTPPLSRTTAAQLHRRLSLKPARTP